MLFIQGHLGYQIKWNHNCSSMIANIMPADPPTLGGGGGGGSEHGLVAYQIKWNLECSNKQAHILTLHILSTPRVKTFFLKFLLHIKLEGNGA